MRLYTNQIPNRQAVCAGCLEYIDQSQGYIQLELDDNDGSVQELSFAKYAEFHTQRCIAMLIKGAYAAKHT